MITQHLQAVSAYDLRGRHCVWRFNVHIAFDKILLLEMYPVDKFTYEENGII